MTEIRTWPPLRFRVVLGGKWVSFISSRLFWHKIEVVGLLGLLLAGKRNESRDIFILQTLQSQQIHDSFSCSLDAWNCIPSCTFSNPLQNATNNFALICSPDPVRSLRRKFVHTPKRASYTWVFIFSYYLFLHPTLYLNQKF